MDDETRQPRLPEDYMNMIMATLKVNTPHDAWQKVEELTAQTNLVLVKDGQFALAGGVKVSVWRRVADVILAMVDEAVIQ